MVRDLIALGLRLEWLCNPDDLRLSFCDLVAIVSTAPAGTAVAEFKNSGWDHTTRFTAKILQLMLARLWAEAQKKGDPPEILTPEEERAKKKLEAAKARRPKKAVIVADDESGEIRGIPLKPGDMFEALGWSEYAKISS